ncbi:GNAT family N-acetyltransferase [Longimicrobium terrae]|uniref:GNAT superfamily N-acetyltransferase n=1 Tax=Longimicrobium terrae TaxID=1639882 RepID=A0A841H8F7_9BACT|nr:GNAT family N-acetyltransferase [Longimicrobium terrae]MBB4639572.1 GNAT superfamily N-acetyltransferase [Longimicrobium terrae]MBB6073969.1 GNAT superfamily N-acetyltransferase [Longimicrobium terrae]NNC29133.1 GNAT family N-acetyltransferase [Longimicrobium terrae]
MTEPVIRRATAADLPAIITMLADDALGRKREDPTIPLDARYTDAFHAIDSDPNQLLAVVERAGEVVGTFQLTFLPGLSHRGAWRGLVEAVRIAQSERSGGLGATLMQWAIGQCRERGCRMVQLTTDKSRTDAHRFYERLGFRATHEGMKLVL